MAEISYMVVATRGADRVNCAAFKYKEHAEAQAKDMNEDEVAMAEGWSYSVEEVEL